MGITDKKAEEPHGDKPLSEMIVVTISKDKLEATLDLFLDRENITMTAEELMDILREKKVTFGIEEAVVKDIAHNPHSYMGQPVVVARGKAPVAGENGRIEYTFEQIHTNKPKEREDGTVDFYNVLTLMNINKGQMLAKKILPTKGEPGMAVTGDEIKAKDGREVHFSIGKNVLLDQEKMHAYAAIDGQISITEKNKMNVFSVYEVKGDVDFSVGNIDFVGNVVIRGNIQPGFVIKAGGDIRVMGSVESATLIAGGSIEITGGIIGHHKGYVQAGVDLKTAFIQEGIASAEQDVIVSQTIMRSDVRAGRDIICKATKGLIVGGSVQAGERVIAKIVGNSSNTMTTIEVGVKPQLREEQEKLRNEIRESKKEIEKAEISLAYLDQMLAQLGKLPADKQNLRIKFLNSKLIAEKKIETSEDRLKEIEHLLNGPENARIECSGIMYSGTKLVIGRAVRFIKENCSRMYFRLGEDGEISSHIL
ncbi:DUF342 domain-containing protein [Aneurinibacillus terranovensis]|uniref:DUF342 domain-containing protein n=1 Tax=Aneurinibacillus terranovensis TaxID=278991 RepID=UPI00138ADC80|nr:FapA family protein [Aneurinibacillus terranovensis]